MNKNEKITWMIAGALVAGLGIEWFTSGSNQNYSQLRNLLVGLQILLGIGMLFYAYFKKKT